MKKLLFVMLIIMQSQTMLAQIKANHIEVESRENTQISGDLSLIQGEFVINGGNPKFRLLESDRANKNFSVEVSGGIFKIREVSDANDKWDRILINGNNDRVGINSGDPKFTLDVNGSFGAKYMTLNNATPFIRFFENDQVDKNWHMEGKDGRFRILTMSDVPDNFSEKFTILHNGNAGVGNAAPRYKLEVGSQVHTKGSSADQDADIMSNGGITISRNKLLTFDEGHKAHANMSYVSSGGELRFKQQGYYGFDFVTRNDRSSLAIKGNNGFVGILNSNPQAQLHVNGAGRISSNNPIIRFEELDNTTHGRWELSANGGRFRVIKTDNLWGNRVDLFTVRGSSTFVGISELNPQAQLHVNGESGIKLTNDSASPDARMMIKPSINVSSLNPGYTTAGAQITNRYFGHLVIDIRANDDNDAFAIRTDVDKNGVVDKIAMVVKPSGDVGIGVTNPQEKLHVNGKIKTAANTWSDFVFEDSYELPKLEEVEDHIDIHGHLKDIPSEKEVLEEGYVLGDMDAKLLQKIEELTLYLIEQNKEMKDLKARLEKAEKALKEVRND